jgi:hypothetical protein
MKIFVGRFIQFIPELILMIKWGIIKKLKVSWILPIHFGSSFVKLIKSWTKKYNITVIMKCFLIPNIKEEIIKGTKRKLSKAQRQFLFKNDY